MNALKIYLARHGQDEDNANSILNGHRDTPLTDVGIKQAKTVADNIKKAGLKFNAIYSSPLQRAFRTAELISDKTDSPSPEKLDLLIERDFGVMTGVSKDKIEEMCSPDDILKTNHINYFLSPEGSETFPKLMIRAKKLLDFVDSRHSKDDSVLLVTHGDFGKMIYAAYYDLDWKDVLKNFHFGNSEVLLLAEDSSAEDNHIFEIQQHNN